MPGPVTVPREGDTITVTGVAAIGSVPVPGSVAAIGSAPVPGSVGAVRGAVAMGSVAAMGGVPMWIVNSQAGLSRTSYGGVVGMTDRRAASCGPVVINSAAYAAVAMVLVGISRKNSRRVNRA